MEESTAVWIRKKTVEGPRRWIEENLKAQEGEKNWGE